VLRAGTEKEMLNEFSPIKGAKKKRKRVGRGAGSMGKTSGRGHKGQGSRSGKGVSRWFEGGQTPLKMRSPKRGFTNIFRKHYEIVNLKDLERFADSEPVTVQTLIEAGIVSGKKPVKLLSTGQVAAALSITVNACSKAAEHKVNEAGGKVEIV